MKKLINDPRLVVREMLEGMVDAYPALALLADENVVVRTSADASPGRTVAIISGGGSGHEPAHAGYIGSGMLTAAVAGDIFTSPSVDAVLAAIRYAGRTSDVLLIVKNYTGDRLNFGLAAELARLEGIAVETVIVGDDVALGDRVPRDRRRGIAGTVLVHKLAGAAAESGDSLRQVAEIAQSAAADVRSMGVGIGLCTLPAAGKPGYVLADDEVELGLGIHGEKGASRIKTAAADTLVDTVLDAIVADLAPASGAPVALLVNGLGGTPPMELAIVMRRALANLRARGLGVARAWMGNFMTALEMPGFSLSVLPVDADRLRLLDAVTDAPAWPRSGALREQRDLVGSPSFKGSAPPEAPAAGPLTETMRRVVDGIADRLIAAEPTLTDLDAKAGDGDLGASMVRGAEAIRALPETSYASPDRLLLAMATAIRRAIGGSSGPFYATGLVRAAATLRGIGVPSEEDWRNALESAIDAISELGGAKRGDRTMLDALIPAVEAWTAEPVEGLAAAVRAAERGAEATADMHPRLGRASYLSERALGVPDGGAVAVSVWLGAIVEALGKATDDAMLREEDLA
jgi:ATP-dependent dihydroxyacetone kinase